MPPRRISKRSSTGSASSTSTVSSHITSTHPRFGQQLDRNGIVFARSRVSAPKDLDELLEDLNRRRESKSPSECEYRSYLEVVETSYNEETLTRAFDTIAKVQRHRSPATAEEHRRYVTVYNLTWTESAACVQEGISNPKPDIIEAFTTDAYPADALEHLGGAMAPSKHPPAMAAFVVHTKGPNGSMDEAEKQCAYDGAVMVDAALQAHTYTSGSDPTSESAFHHQTQALTVAFNGEDLHISAHHRTQLGKYHLYPVVAEKPPVFF